MTSLDRAFIKAFTDPSPPAEAEGRPVATEASKPAEAQRPEVAMAASEPEEAHDEEPKPAPLPLSSFAREVKVQDSFRPLLEVDRVAFPPACGELLGRAGRDWDHFAEQLIEQMGQGRKCIAVAGLSHGDGATTVALTVAKHVAARGLRPVVVDADPRNPALARSCGVAVQTGWNDLVASELPLGEALITAVEDGVTLMPLRAGHQSIAQLTESLRTASIFGTLREHYDLVLLDLMPSDERTAAEDLAAFASAIRLDALYLIHNVRTVSGQQLSAACAKLRGAGLPLAAVIENFVPPTVPGGPSASQGAPLAVSHGLTAGS